MPFVIHRGMSQSYSTQRDKNISKLAGYSSSDRRYEERNHDSPANEVSDLFSFIGHFKIVLIVNSAVVYFLGVYDSAFGTNIISQ